MIEEEREREWLRELEESVVNINDGVNELIELQNNLNSECNSIEVFAEHIVGDSNMDLTLLLDILNPSNVVSADVWANFGMRISGRRRGFRTCVEVNILQFCSSPLDIENECLLNAVFAARATTTRIDREVVNDAGTEFTLISPAGDTQSKNRRPRQPLLPTLDPFIKGCILGESWDYQQMRQKRVPRLSNSDLEAHTDAVPIDSVAEAVVADTTTDHLCWAQCDSCGKWRTTKRLLEEDEQFVCNDTSITRNLQFAQCDAPEEPWA